MASPPSRPTRTDFVRRRTVALGVAAGLLLVLIAFIRGDGGAKFDGSLNAKLTPAQESKLPWKQRYVSGSAGPLDGSGLPAPAAQRAAVRRYFRIGLPIYCAGGRGNFAALTFDDGPAKYSAQVRQLLAAAGVKSTFFLIGQSVVADPASARADEEAGGVANHTWSHANLESLGPAELRADLNRTSRKIAEVTREPVTLMRPPYGARNAAVDRAVHRMGMLPILWDVDSRDSAGAGSAEIAANSDEGMRPGAIILMHDTYDRSLAALPNVLRSAKTKRVRLVSVPQLLALDPPPESLVRAGPLACSDRARYQAEEDATAMRLPS